MQREEGSGRLRFLSREEYDKLHKVISKRFPEHLAEFVVSVHKGMRLSEQYTCTWSQVHLDRRTIELTKTNNGSGRTGPPELRCDCRARIAASYDRRLCAAAHCSGRWKSTLDRLG